MVYLIAKILKYVPTKARAQAASFGFQKSQARPSAGPSFTWLFLAWPGLAWLLASGWSQNITTTSHLAVSRKSMTQSSGGGMKTRQAILIYC